MRLEGISPAEIAEAQQDLIRIGVHAAQARRLVRALEEARAQVGEVEAANDRDGFLVDAASRHELEMLHLSAADATQRARQWLRRIEGWERALAARTPPQRPFRLE